ncbi:aminodeoxychorismate lyase [Marinobacterium marinum]|uniref:Aminodeoxychorismate lyase n=1 Tax=Marinobacterium marinum TaxID=2756129 RepID=A0A7W2ABP1_9GAMM|nr:aminodeoxychorismate lyase [Marinobacterium marinum]MBA4502260.1 aminodeoxychorismate lyase [Marinobacterium marinum]
MLVNGHPGEHVDAIDRGVAYGHGLFETFLVINGVPIFYAEHLNRLLSGCERLGIPTQGLAEQLRHDLQLLSFPEGYSVLKLILTCGSGGRGYLTPNPASPTRIFMLSAMPVYPDQPHQGIRVRWCQTRLACQPLLSGIKHLNRLEQVLARNEWQDPSVREGLVCDSRGYVIEGTMSNLCFIRGNRLYTPALDQCGVEGIVRNQVLILAESSGLGVEIGHYRPQDVEAADEVFVCNSLIGIWPVIELGGRSYAWGRYTRQLQAAFNQRMVQC